MVRIFAVQDYLIILCFSAILVRTYIVRSMLIHQLIKSDLLIFPSSYWLELFVQNLDIGFLKRNFEINDTFKKKFLNFYVTPDFVFWLVQVVLIDWHKPIYIKQILMLGLDWRELFGQNLYQLMSRIVFLRAPRAFQ